MGFARRLLDAVARIDAKGAGLLRPLRRRVFVSAALAFVLVLVAAGCRHAGVIDDDWSISLLLHPRYEESGELCLFVNAALSRLIRGLDEAVPAVNWFFPLELATAFVSFAALLFALLSYAPLCLAAFLAGVAAVLVLPGCTYMSNFTYVASLASLAGGALLLGRSFAPARSRAAAAVAVFLCAAGFCWRAESFYLSVPFFAIGAFAPLLTGRAGAERVTWRAVAAALAPYLAVLAAVGALGLYDAQQWSRPPWSDWARFNNARSALSDFPTRPYGEIAGELEALGVSENDYYLMTHWVVDDDKAFSTEVLEQVGAVAADRRPGGYLANAARHVAHSKMLPCFALAAAVVLACCRRARRPLWAVAAVALGCACLMAFAALGRLPDRVERPVCLYALVAAVLAAGPFKGLPCAGRPLDPQTQGTPLPVCVSGTVAAVSGVALLLGFALWQACSFDARFLGSSLGVSSGEAQPGSVAARMEEQGGDLLYVWDAKSYGPFERSYRLKDIPSSWAGEHNPSLGGWDVGSPGYLKRNERLGSGLLEALAFNPDARLVTGSDEFAHRVHGFLREHYDPQISMGREGELEGPRGHGRDSLGVYAFRRTGGDRGDRSGRPDGGRGEREGGDRTSHMHKDAAFFY